MNVSLCVLFNMSYYVIASLILQGEVLRTRGGGTSVQFTDVEVLKHSRPKTPRERAAVRRSTRLATKRRPINVVTASTNSGSSSDSSLSSSCESSLGEQYTDVESRVSYECVSIDCSNIINMYILYTYNVMCFMYVFFLLCFLSVL